MYASASASRAAASIALAPSRQISSSIDRPSERRSRRSLRSTLAFLPRRRSTVGSRLISTRTVRRVSERVGDPQLQVISPGEEGLPLSAVPRVAPRRSTSPDPPR